MSNGSDGVMVLAVVWYASSVIMRTTRVTDCFVTTLTNPYDSLNAVLAFSQAVVRMIGVLV